MAGVKLSRCFTSKITL